MAGLFALSFVSSLVYAVFYPWKDVSFLYFDWSELHFLEFNCSAKLLQKQNMRHLQRPSERDRVGPIILSDATGSY